MACQMKRGLFCLASRRSFINEYLPKPRLISTREILFRERVHQSGLLRIDATWLVEFRVSTNAVDDITLNENGSDALRRKSHPGSIFRILEQCSLVVRVMSL